MKVIFQSDILDYPRESSPVHDVLAEARKTRGFLQIMGDRDLSRFRENKAFMGYRFTLQNPFYCLPGREETIYMANQGLTVALANLGIDIVPEGHESPFNRILQQLLAATPDFTLVLARMYEAAMAEFGRLGGMLGSIESSLAERFRGYTPDHLNCATDMYLEERLTLWRWIHSPQTFIWFVEKRPGEWIRNQADYSDEIAASREASLLYFLRFYGTFLGQILWRNRTLEFNRTASIHPDNPLWRRAGARIHYLLGLPWEYRSGEERISDRREESPPREEEPPDVLARVPEDAARFGRYLVLDTIGDEQVESVLHCVDPVIGREVIVKTLSIGKFSEQQERAWWDRFFHEARLAAGLNHPHIVKVYDLGEENGVPYLVMQYVDGPSLRKWIENGLEMPFEKKLRVVQQVADALDYAHRKGIVHRNIRPENVLIDSNGMGILADFGIAAIRGLDRDHEEVGKSQVYAAPEVLLGESPEASSDIFSFAATTFEFLFQCYPFLDSEGEISLDRLTKAEPNFEKTSHPCMNLEMEEVFSTAMARSCVNRYPSAGDFCKALSRGLPV